ncbi:MULTISPECIES: DUF202 domain-containing protein [Streptomyces]|uniref:DUF202 domain-containing protein n=1 Tax=Streptomyces qinglanensis TaxID=943816 RepID=A0A1E7K3H1_9ACTN|nr:MULTISPECIES: DUF202 domain-containing protein [Streptomyces]MBE9499337.1 DUF202 domain-containing protein [Streptomyces sp. GKU 257-1]OEU98478.1 hypothetical protein AN217_12380 [Streptomyces qinglanensis]
MSGEPPRDPGAQPERTWLAWRRTTLTCAVSVALTARVALADPSGPAVAAACLGALAWVGLLVTAHRRIRALSRSRPRTMGAAQTMGALACVLVLVGVGGMMLL